MYGSTVYGQLGQNESEIIHFDSYESLLKRYGPKTESIRSFDLNYKVLKISGPHRDS